MTAKRTTRIVSQNDRKLECKAEGPQYRWSLGVAGPGEPR